jgi:RimJ/RimL family protein N-acetyltransferase
MRPPKTMTDGEIILAVHSADDANAHFRSEDDEMRRRFPAPRPATVESTQAAVARWITAHASGGPYAYAIKLQTGDFVGGCELRIAAEGVGHISCWIFVQFRGKGYATRAVGLLCRAASVLGVRRLEAHVDRDSRASMRVVEKAGFVRNGSIENEDADGVVRERSRWVLALPG